LNGFRRRQQRIIRSIRSQNPLTGVFPSAILFDQLADGRLFKTLSVLDEFTRECLGIWVATSILAQDVIAFLTTIMKCRGAPVFLRSDNGSEFTAEGVSIRG